MIEDEAAAVAIEAEAGNVSYLSQEADSNGVSLLFFLRCSKFLMNTHLGRLCPDFNLYDPMLLASSVNLI